MDTDTNMGIDLDLGLEPMEGLERALNIRRMEHDLNLVVASDMNPPGMMQCSCDC